MKTTKIVYASEEAKLAQENLKKLVIEMLQSESTLISEMDIQEALDENEYTRNVKFVLTIVDDEE